MAHCDGEGGADALPTAHLQIWWLDPELTYGNAKPFVFTQGHSVCNRSFFPCFDTPAVKCTYSAVVKVSVLQPGPPPCHLLRGSSSAGWGTPDRGAQGGVEALQEENYPVRGVGLPTTTDVGFPDPACGLGRPGLP